MNSCDCSAIDYVNNGLTFLMIWALQLFSVQLLQTHVYSLPCVKASEICHFIMTVRALVNKEHTRITSYTCQHVFSSYVHRVTVLGQRLGETLLRHTALFDISFVEDERSGEFTVKCLKSLSI